MDRTATAVTSIPIEGLVRDMKRGRCYTLGLASAYSASDRMPCDWVASVARKCIEKTERTAVLIRTQDTASSSCTPSADTNCDSGMACVQWTPWHEPLNIHSPVGRTIRSELASLPQWRQQFSLVVLELGDVRGQSFSGLGKLCDGIGLVASPTSSHAIQELSRSLRRHQADGIRVIGLWTLGSTNR